MADGAANKGIEQIFGSSASIDTVSVFLKGKAANDIAANDISECFYILFFSI